MNFIESVDSGLRLVAAQDLRVTRHATRAGKKELKLLSLGVDS